MDFSELLMESNNIIFSLPFWFFAFKTVFVNGILQVKFFMNLNVCSVSEKLLEDNSVLGSAFFIVSSFLGSQNLSIINMR